MGVRVIYQNVDFSANGIAPELAEIVYETAWTGWLCNNADSTTAQQNASWSTRFFKVPSGVSKVYVTGIFTNANFGASVVSEYNTSNHTYTNVAKNVVVGPGVQTRQEVDLSAMQNANYIMISFVTTASVQPKVEAYM